VPTSLRALSSFPLTPHGKIDLRALLALPIEPGGEEPTAARNRNEARMLALWQEVLGTAQIGIHDNFFELGGTSLLAVQLAGRIRKEWEVHLPVASLFSAQTIAELCHLLQQPRERWMPLAPIQPLGDRTPIFAFHAIGGLVFHYRPMALSIGLTQPLFGVQMRGLDSDSAPFRTLEEMVECYADAITTCYPDGPYRLLGHSFGGLLAVEVARKLVADGHDVSQLVLLDTFPPNRYLAALADDALLLKVFVEHNFGITGLSWWTLHGKSEEERIELLANLPDMPVGKDFLQRSTAILRSIRAMMESYQLRPVSVPILLLRPEKPARALRNSTLGWEKLTPQLTTRVIPGDHHSMVNYVTLEMLE
jgi:thioesterase domain-containing protein